MMITQKQIREISKTASAILFTTALLILVGFVLFWCIDRVDKMAVTDSRADRINESIQEIREEVRNLESAIERSGYIQALPMPVPVEEEAGR